MIPDLISPVIGFKDWYLQDHTIHSWYNTEAWQPGVKQALCPHYSHQAPHGECTCGLYAHYEPYPTGVYLREHCPLCYEENPRDNVFAYVLKTQKVYPVPGLIKAWGRLEAHATGFRAQYMQPLALAIYPECNPNHYQTIASVAQGYNLDLYRLEELGLESLKYGRTLDPKFRPSP